MRASAHLLCVWFAVPYTNEKGWSTCRPADQIMQCKYNLIQQACLAGSRLAPGWWTRHKRSEMRLRPKVQRLEKRLCCVNVLFGIPDIRLALNCTVNVTLSPSPKKTQTNKEETSPSITHRNQQSSFTPTITQVHNKVSLWFNLGTTKGVKVILNIPYNQ